MGQSDLHASLSVQVEMHRKVSQEKVNLNKKMDASILKRANREIYKAKKKQYER